MLKNSKPIVGISVGDPNGIGIEVILKSLKDATVLEKCSVVVFSNFKLIKNQMSYFNIDLPLKEVSQFNNYDERCINVHPINKKEIKIFKNKKIKTKNSHGTGCTLSSAITTYFSCGKTLKKSCEMAIKYVNHSLRTQPNLGKGHGPVNHLNSIQIKNNIR